MWRKFQLTRTSTSAMVAKAIWSMSFSKRLVADTTAHPSPRIGSVTIQLYPPVASIRTVFTIVKVNNELERIAYCSVTIAEVVEDAARMSEKVPPQLSAALGTGATTMAAGEFGKASESA